MSQTKYSTQRKENGKYLESFLKEKSVRLSAGQAGTRKKQHFSPCLSVEQQEEQHHAVALTVDTQLENNQSRQSKIRGLNFKALKSAILTGKLGLKPGQDLYTEDELWLLWNSLVGNIVLNVQQTDAPGFLETRTIAGEVLIARANKRFSGLSLEAASRLFACPERFQNGISLFRQHPEWVVVTSDNQTTVLHHDKEEQQQETCFPSLLPPPVEMPAMEEDILTLLLDHFDCLKAHYLDPRLKDFIARQVGRLVHLTQYQQELLFNTCKGNVEAMEYLLDHAKKIASLEGTTDSFLLEVLAAHARRFSLTGKTMFLYANVLSQPMEKLPSSLILDILAPMLDPLTLNKIKGLAFEAQFAMLQLYAKYGKNGIKALLKLKTHPVFHEIPESFLLKKGSWLPLIDNVSRMQRAFNTLELFKLNPDKYQWWTTLLQKHADALVFDDLPNLVDTFSRFSETLENRYQLAFYPLDAKAFEGVKSLPFALSTMLAILNENKEQDRLNQWQKMPAIPLSLMTITALNERQNGDCSFIHPDMEVETVALTFDWHHGHASVTSAKNILPSLPAVLAPEWKFTGSDSLEATRIRFYRYLAYTAYKLPISIYEELDREIAKQQGLMPELKAMLYVLVASTTTGKSNSFACGIDEEALIKSLKAWKALINRFGNFSSCLMLKTMEAIQGMDMRMIMLSLPLEKIHPPFKYVQTIMDCFMAYLSNNLAGIFTFFELFESLDLLNFLQKRYDTNFYAAIEFGDSKRCDKFFLFQFLEKAILLIAGESAVQPASLSYGFMEIMGLEHVYNSHFHVYKDTLDPSEVCFARMKAISSYEDLVKTTSGRPALILTEDNALYFANNLTRELTRVDTDSGKSHLANAFKSEIKNAAKDIQLIGRHYFYFSKDSAFTALTGYSNPLYHHKKAFSALFGVMSHFGLIEAKNDKIKAVREAFIKACEIDETRVEQALKLIQTIRKPDSMLDADKCMAFLSLLNSDCTKSVVAVVEAHFANYFSAEFFAVYAAKELPREVLLKISERFEREQRPAVESMLKYFMYQAGNFVNLENNLMTVELVSRLLTHVHGEDRVQLFKYLTNPRFHGKSIHAYLDLLDVMNTKNKVVYFLYFSEKNIGVKDKNLLLKATWLLQHIGEFLQYSKDQLTPTEVLDLLIAKLAMTKEAGYIFQTATVDFFGELHNFLSEKNHLKMKFSRFLAAFVKAWPDADNAIIKMLVAHLAWQDDKVVEALFFHLTENPHLLDLQSLVSQVNGLRDAGLFWSVIVKLLNNDFAIESANLDKLLRQFNSHVENIALFYANPPYPDLKSLVHFLKGTETYEAFIKAPYPRDPQSNGFHKSRVAGILKQIKPAQVIDPLAVLDFDHKIRAARGMTVEDIQKALKSRQLMASEKVALCAELLYLTKGYELNTNQYLTAWIALDTERNVTLGVDTGEGKSRINMVIAACQFISGQDLTFCTKDMLLAERDYLSYSVFFEALGAATQLIQGNTATPKTHTPAIRFTTIDDYALYLGAAHVKGQLHQVIHPDARKRSLILDEADHIYYDLSNTRFNFSVDDPEMETMGWIYEAMVRFFYRYPEAKDWDATYCDAELSAFIESQSLKEGVLFKNCPKEERLLWQEAALAAMDMTLQDAFTIQSNVQKIKKQAILLVSEAKVIIKATNRAHPIAQFAHGVHQFLHARLNYLKQLLSAQNLDINDVEIGNYFKDHPDCQPFLIDPAKMIVYSLSSKGVLDFFKDGRIIGATATPGDEGLQLEAEALYGMQTLCFPGARPLKRVTEPTYLAGSQKAQFKRIAHEIRQAQEANQPVLLVCQNDLASLALQTYLHKKGIENCIRLSAETTRQVETHHIEKRAGLPKMVTITTSMHGRGTDIPLAEASKVKGLKVIVSYLPGSKKDLIQIFGRAGRFGAEGQASLVLNKALIKQQLGKHSLTEGYYTCAETWIDHQLAIHEQNEQQQRVIQFIVMDFLKVLQDGYYAEINDLASATERQAALQQLGKFLARADRCWKEQLSSFQEQLSVESVKASLLVFEAHCLETNPAQIATDAKMDNRLLTTEAFLFRKIHFNPLKVPYADCYHPAFDGRAVLYEKPFEKWRATLRGDRPFFADFKAWYQGRGILFPQFRAWLQGALTLNALLFGSSTLSSDDMKLANRIFTGAMLGLGFFLGAGIAIALAVSGIFIPFGLGVAGLTLCGLAGAGLGLLVSETLLVFRDCCNTEQTVEEFRPYTEETLAPELTEDLSLYGPLFTQNRLELEATDDKVMGLSPRHF